MTAAIDKIAKAFRPDPGIMKTIGLLVPSGKEGSWS
jgi:hypothetical protein